MGSPEAYLMDSFSSIFLKPEIKKKKLTIRHRDLKKLID